ncbi:hypothetical protein [Nocardia testacea]|uniref:hypothetical protein n=1 Tax=Nocardia testacea TaxID=248551 RepID=UPI003A8848CC
MPGRPLPAEECDRLWQAWAKARRPKDESDFLRVLPAMDRSRRSRLSEWLSRVHPGHPWMTALSHLG